MKRMKRWLQLAGIMGIAGTVLLGSQQITLASESVTFTDVPSSHWAYPTVMWSKDQGITDGYPDGTFKPSKPVTESEFLVMLLRAYPEIQLGEKGLDEAWHEPYYRLARELKWPIYGIPSDVITRGRAAQLMVEILGQSLAKVEAAQILLDKGIAQGKKGAGVDGFAVNDALTRAEAQTFLYKLKQQLPKVTDPEMVIPDIELQGVRIGDTEAKVVATLGEPDRKDTLNDKMKWYIYKGYYKNYMQIGIMDQKVVALFSVGTGWRFNGTDEISLADLKVRAEGLWGEELESDNVLLYTPRGVVIKLFTDAHEAGRLDGLFVTSNYAFDNIYEMEVTEDTYRSYELEILDLTNVFRVSKGLGTLTWNDQAADAARLHSADMAARNYFEHNNLEGKTPGDRMAAQGLISFKAWGENIAAGHTNAIDAHYGWVNSLGHRINLLREQFAWLGVGVKRAEKNNEYGIYYTQNFYTPLYMNK